MLRQCGLTLLDSNLVEARIGELASTHTLLQRMGQTAEIVDPVIYLQAMLGRFARRRRAI